MTGWFNLSLGLAGVIALVLAAILAGLLIRAMWPLLTRYALARPNARSSHRQPTPQGGGIAVIAATLVVTAACLLVFSTATAWGTLACVFASAILLAVVGGVDDIRILEALTRLFWQLLAVVVVIATVPSELRLFPPLPFWLERALLVLAGVWFINLVNFMDGIDWITVAEFVPISAAIALFGLMGFVSPETTLLAFALCGALLGFAPFNRPVARLFLGDVGSLPLGLLTGWLLLQLAVNGQIAAAALLPLYYLADATITLLRRLARGAQVVQAHREHFYQQAYDGGLSARQVVGRVFLVNIGLAALALATTVTAWPVTAALCAAGAIVVGFLIASFRRKTA
jgi:UDP-N-acetylmuramyl pentapeptide phosphotransferase/UDP-N-acetylglucosamine-1-phosphate transferase